MSYTTQPQLSWQAAILIAMFHFAKVAPHTAAGLYKRRGYLETDGRRWRARHGVEAVMGGSGVGLVMPEEPYCLRAGPAL